MSDKKKKIEKYTEAEQIGIEDQESLIKADKDKPDKNTPEAEGMESVSI